MSVQQWRIVDKFHFTKVYWAGTTAYEQAVEKFKSMRKSYDTCELLGSYSGNWESSLGYGQCHFYIRPGYKDEDGYVFKNGADTTK